MGEQASLLTSHRYPEIWARDCFLDGAGFSADRKYRYWLSRKVENPGTAPNVPILWIMLNPSVANETVLDPTLRRCMSFTRRLGGTQMMIGNLFALVSTDPRGLLASDDPVGPYNDTNLGRMIDFASAVIVGWGSHQMAEKRARELLELFPTLPFQCLGTNANGSPKHPLYLPKSAQLRPWPQ